MQQTSEAWRKRKWIRTAFGSGIRKDCRRHCKASEETARTRAAGEAQEELEKADARVEWQINANINT